MRASIRIERVVLDGIQLSRRERDALGPAITHELRLLANGLADRAEIQHQAPGSAVHGIAREIAAEMHRASIAAWPAARRGSR
jgi:hypothetical protein